MISEVLWVLIALQIAMGAFDTLYHHELTERLAWRPSQQHELELHAVRNGLYGLLFLILAFLEVHGWWAILVMAVLLVEVAITLMESSATSSSVCSFQLQVPSPLSVKLTPDGSDPVLVIVVAVG